MSTADLFMTGLGMAISWGHSGGDLEPRTKINIDAIDGDMPHHYFTEPETRELFKDFSICRLEHYTARSEKNPDRMSATWALYASRP